MRDAIDRVVEGRVRAAGHDRVPRTFRDHALRMTADFWPEAVGINLGLGRSADAPLDRWDESFLPDRLADLLRQVRLPDGTGEKKLVKTERIVYQDVRPSKPALPPKQSCGQYYYANTADELGPIFDSIASRIYTKITY